MATVIQGQDGGEEGESKQTSHTCSKEKSTLNLRHLLPSGPVETNCRLEHEALLQFFSLCELTVLINNRSTGAVFKEVVRS